jgi:hypothetical protein
MYFAFWTQPEYDPIAYTYIRLSSALDSPSRFLQILSPLFWEF